MKTQIKLLKKIMFLCLFIMTVACSKDDPIIDSPDNGQVEEIAPTISLDEFETDEGEIGISFSARDIAKRGYKPTTVVISIQSNSTLEDQTLEFDEFNNLANLSFKNEDLDDTVESDLKEGVPVNITVKDINGSVLATENYTKLSFRASPQAQKIDASKLDDLYAEVSLQEGLDYYVQLVDKDNVVFGAPSSHRYINGSIREEMRLRGSLDYDNDDELLAEYTRYRFSKIPGNEEYFSIAKHDGNNIHYLYMRGNQLFIQSRGNLETNGGNLENIEAFSDYWFKIEKQGPGLFKIVPRGTENPLIVSGSNFVTANSSDPDKPTYFRILLFNIDWNILAIESKFVRPIMPPSGTNSAYNSTLKNCSTSSSLAQGISEDTKIITTQTAGWEESMSVATTNSAGVSVTISHEAETKFFGVGGKTSGSITGNYQYTKTRTETNTKSGSLSTEKSVEVSVKRDVSVPPGAAISVADVYQQYENIKVPFIQRFRIFGKYQDDNSELTGQEILTQFSFNSFTGVITDVQSNFIEVTVRGNTTIDRLIDTLTEVRDVPGACN